MGTNVLIRNYKSLESKNPVSLTFYEVICLVFEACNKLAIIDTRWETYLSQYTNEIKKQEQILWPILSPYKNYYAKRVDVILSKSFNPTTSFLVHLHRLLFIEDYKEKITGVELFYYRSIMEHIIPLEIGTNSIEDISLGTLLNLLKQQMKRYIRIYNTEENIEYIIAKTILNHL